ncbi:hypothetical protein WDW37_18910 [Bdellovibrionota bacterium FG-1]
MDRRIVLLALLLLGVETWFLVSDVHFFWKPPRVPAGAVRVAQVASVLGGAKARSPLQLNWFDLKPGQELYEGDEIATMAHGSVNLLFAEGQRVTLEPDSFLVLKSSSQAGVRSSVLSLVHGGLDSKGATASLEIEVSGRKVLTQGTAGFKIESSGLGQAPKIEVTGTQGQKDRVWVTEIPKTGIEISPVKLGPQEAKTIQPLLKGPEGVSVVEGPTPFTLKWNSADLAGGLTVLEVSRDPAFREIVFHKMTQNEGSVIFLAEHKGQYFWRVSRLLDGHEIHSAVSSFEVRFKALPRPVLRRPRVEQVGAAVPPPAELTAPVLSTPFVHYQKQSQKALKRPLLPASRGRLAQAGWRRWLFRGIQTMDETLMVSAYGAESGLESTPPSRYVVELNWDAVPKAAGYTLQIASDEEFLHLVAERVLKTHSFSWHTETAGFFYWRVAALDAEGDHGALSEFNTFSIRAEQNIPGNETSYDSYLPFDEYSKYRSHLRFGYGPTFNRYDFLGERSDSPSSVRIRYTNWADAQFNYDYRLDSHDSLQILYREERSRPEGGDFIDRTNQAQMVQYETIFGAFMERRFFLPHQYFSVQLGVRISYIDLPIHPAGRRAETLSSDVFAFFGGWAVGGYHRLLGRSFEASVFFGAGAQFTGASGRYTQYGGLELKRQLSEGFGLGVRFDELLTAYRFNETNLAGSGHALNFMPIFFTEIGF